MSNAAIATKTKHKTQLPLFESPFLTPKEASLWASEYTHKNVTGSNITYLINYGRIANHGKHGEYLIDKVELQKYYDERAKSPTISSPLSFAEYKEAETTKHIHRLHPYKGKFIPQLVEYFLDDRTDELKTQACFHAGDTVLDLFCGSGTTLAVANELGLNAVGIDVSLFNAILANSKIKRYDLPLLENELNNLISKLNEKVLQKNTLQFENELNEKLSAFNEKYFPKEFKRRVVLKEIDEKTYGKEKAQRFLGEYKKLVEKYHVDISTKQDGNFFEKWYLNGVREEILFLKNEIEKSPEQLQDILRIILSRTARSCRATTHSDLATLISPVTTTYYCTKHGRICKPLFGISKWFSSYAKDTLKRLREFDALRTNTTQLCLTGSSTSIDIVKEVKKINPQFAEQLEQNKIAGIFSSPPYCGLIDYHEQHAYAYDIFNLPRNDEKEIGRLQDGQTKVAQENYVHGIAKALINVKKFLKDDYNIFLVVNDKFNLYPRIAEMTGMKIVKRYERPVLNRSEGDKNKYTESIFHLKECEE